MINCVIHCISINVRGIRNRLKRSKVIKWLQYQMFDVALLQETFLSKELEFMIKLNRNNIYYFNHGTNHYYCKEKHSNRNNGKYC